MRKRRQSLDVVIRPVRLYLDDLLAIEEVLRSEFGEVAVTTGEYELESVEELEELGRGAVLKEFNIRAVTAPLSVSVRNGGAFVYAADDDARSEGVHTKLTRIVAARKRWFGRFLRPWLATFVGFGSAAVGLGLLASEDIAVRLGGFLLAVLGLGYFGAAYYFDVHAGGSVVAARRSESPSFLRRNKDRIVVGVIVGVLVYLLTNYLPER